MIPKISIKKEPHIHGITLKWSPPAQGFLKLNFDVASKVNPSRAIIDSIIRYINGRIIHIYFNHKGTIINNAMKFHFLEQGLDLLVWTNIQNINIEGDSSLVIKMVKRLHFGTNVGNFMAHQHMGYIIQWIQGHLESI